MEERVYRESMEELDVMKKRIAVIKDRIKKYPPGYLKINHRYGKAQYYHMIGVSGTAGQQKQNEKGEMARYIRKKDNALAVLLAQKSHDIRLLKELEIRKTALEQLLSSYSGTDPYNICESYCDERKKLVTSEYVSDQQFVKAWQEVTYQRKGFAENSSEIYTVKGERVRSKSEKIIADTLERFRIPYHYEYPVELSGGLLIHPDFHVLNTRTRKEYFWEHLGKMDDPEYSSNAVKRLEQMAENGILPGKNLILTAETSMKPMNVRILNLLIREYLI